MPSGRPVSFSRGDVGTHAPLVAAVDLGTTNISAVVFECRSGIEAGRASVPNRQQAFGADVLSRMARASAGDAESLAIAARESVSEAILLAAGDRIGDLERVVIAGNSAMAALLAGVDASGLAVAPFEAPELPASPFEDLIPGVRCAVDVLPPIASFVGGDTRAGIFATGIVGATRPQLLLDIGTNAEVALVADGRLTVTSAAAGPAFEGAGLSCGGPAVDGAGVEVRVSGDTVELRALGDSEVRWLSGSGVVSAVAELLVAGHIDQSGRLTQAGPLERRFRRVDDVLAVDLGSDEYPVLLTQLDVRSLQLAKAAVRVAVEKVLAFGGVRASELEALHVAGAFGAALPAKALVGMGLIPKGSAAVLRYAGNASLNGAAALACREVEAGPTFEDALSSATHVDLARDPGFTEALMAAMEFGGFDV
jgi:uncharacterized 2Fe-2S/4Fe-4S cluster protein (DUF4445 family)